MSKLENSTKELWICKSYKYSISIYLLCRPLALNRSNPNWVSGDL